MKNSLINFLKKQKTFNKTFIFFVIVISLLIIPTIIVNRYANTIIITKQIEANENYLSYLTNYVNEVFLSIRNSCYDLMRSEEYNNYVRGFNDDMKDLTLDTTSMIDKLKNISNSNSFVKSIAVYSYNQVTGKESLIAQEGTYVPGVYFDNLNVREGYNYDFWKGMINKQFSLDILSSASSFYSSKKIREDIITMLVKEHYSKNPMAYMIIDIDEKSLYQVADAINITKNGYMYILDAQNATFINHSDTLGIDKDKNIQKIMKAIKDKNVNSEISLDDKTFLISHSYSGINNMYYLVITQKDVLTKDMVNFLNKSILVILLFVIVGIAVSFSFTRSIYTPLKNTINYVKSMSGDSDEGQNEYEFLKKSFVNMKNFASNSIMSMMNILVYRVINGNISREDADKLIKEYKLPLYKKYYAILSIRTDGGVALTDINRIFSAYGEFVEMSPSIYVLFINIDSAADLDNKLNSLEDEVSEFLKNNKNIEMFVGQSEIFDDITLSHKFYYQAYNIFDLRSICINKLVYNQDDSGLDIIDGNFNSQKKVIANYIYNGNKDKTMEVLEDMLFSFKNNGLTFIKYRQAINELVSIALDALTQRYIDQTYVFDDIDKLMYFMSMAQNPQQMEEKCRDVYSGALDCICKNMDNGSTITRILDYIDTNISLTCLNDMAEKFNMNPNYLSQYFKKHTGVTFINYMNMKKVKKAKEMLLSTQKTIDIISKEVGFNNSGSFIRMFKQIEGITPNNYRENELRSKMDD